MAVIGLDVLSRSGAPRRWWFCVAAVGVIALLAWCVYRSAVLPEPVKSRLLDAVSAGQPIRGVPDAQAAVRVQQTFVHAYLAGAALCALALAGWVLLLLTPRRPKWLVSLLAAVMIADLLWFAHDENPQCDPQLYYPAIPALEKVANAAPGRVVGVGCLPPRIYESHGLWDIRGYDGVDPARFLELLQIGRHPQAAPSPSYARTRNYVPNIKILSNGTIDCPATIDMLHVRYIIGRGEPPRNVVPWISEQDYWVLENPGAMPRAYVPRTVTAVTNDEQALKLLSGPNFDPRQVACVDQPTALPLGCRGAVAVIEEVPGRVALSVQMQTPGLVVLADRWDRGWRAYLDDRPVPILRTNHVLRGVQVSAGDSTLVFDYEPESFKWGLGLMLAAVVGGVGWVTVGAWQRH